MRPAPIAPASATTSPACTVNDSSSTTVRPAQGRVRDGEVLDLEDRRADRGRPRARRAWTSPSSLPVIIGDDRVGRCGVRIADELAIAQHGDAIAQRGDLVEAVRDVDERRAGRRARGSARTAARLSAVGERGGRLVEHDRPSRGRRGRARSRGSAADADAERARPARRGRASRPRPRTARSSRARAARSAIASTMPNRVGSRPSTRFSATDMSGTSDSSWWTTAMPARRASRVPRNFWTCAVDRRPRPCSSGA